MRKIKQYCAFALTLIIMFGCSGQKSSAPTETNDMPMDYITTFKFAKPDRIDIELFNKMSDQRDGIPAAEKIEITDAEKINEIMNYTSALPDAGDIMIKMGDVSIINVTLIYPEKKMYFTIYETRIKTPDTSFYSASPDSEKKLIKLLLSLFTK